MIVRNRQVDDFWIEAHLASGGMARVFLASRKGTEELAVLKVLDEHFRHDEKTKAMFRDEARIMNRLAHPNVVRFFGSGTWDGLPYLALEYLDGDNLSVLRKAAARQGTQLSLSLVTRIGIQVANALDYVHSLTDEKGTPLGLVHRDISPQNIFVTTGGQVKVLDFGIAWSVEKEEKTTTGMLKGKLRYMSPEQIEMQPIDNRSDLFSLGIVLWELITARRLFDAESDFRTMKQICEEPIPSPREHRPGIPAELEKVVMKLLERDRKQRYRNGGQLREDLKEVLYNCFPDSSPREVDQAVRELLSERLEKKRRLIADIIKRGEMESFLFADLSDKDEDSLTSDKRKFLPSMKHRSESTASAEDEHSSVDRDEANSHDSKERIAIFPEGGTWRRLLPALAAAAAIGGFSLFLFTGTDERHTNKHTGSVATTRDPGGQPSAISDTKQRPNQSPPPSSKEDKSNSPAASEERQKTEKPSIETDPNSQVPDRLAVSSESSESESLPAKKTTTAKPQDASPKNVSQEGFLYLKTRPEVMVFLEGKLLGKTPIENMKLPPGLYRLRLLNRDAGIDETITVRIKKNEVTSYQNYYY